MATGPDDPKDLIDEIREAIAADAGALSDIVDLLALLRAARRSDAVGVPREEIWSQISTRLSGDPGLDETAGNETEC